jgi:hypothetical protein
VWLGATSRILSSAIPCRRCGERETVSLTDAVQIARVLPTSIKHEPSAVEM